MRHNVECDIMPNCDIIPNTGGPVRFFLFAFHLYAFIYFFLINISFTDILSKNLKFSCFAFCQEVEQLFNRKYAFLV